MYRWFSFFLVVTTFLAVAAASATIIAPAVAAPTAKERHVTVDGLDRRYLAYLPQGYQQKGALPVVLAFHGGFGDPEQFARVTGLQNAPAAKTFIVVFPEGYERSWNVGGVCCGGAKAKNVDEVKFVRAILNDLDTTARIDRQRVYATGWSNGGGLSFYLACAMSREITAIAPVSSSMRYPKSQCHPARPIPVLEFHGMQDQISPYMGGSTTATHEGPPPSVPDTIAFWTNVDGTKNVSHVKMFGNAADCDIYSGGQGGAKVEQCRIAAMGHRWPGSHSTPTTLQGDAMIAPYVGDLGPYAPSVDANGVMLQFFRGE